MNDDSWPQLMTARDLCERRILPVSEDTIRALARKAGVGRILGRTYVFEPADVRALLASLPCPSAPGPHVQAVTAEPSADVALARALELSRQPQVKRRGSRRPPLET